ncbi:MAG: hypothetical protein IT372_06220, partial [Polyangiaceae bacterium]|nr:hypothetical protein [Polyangiaceae bacterium]
MARTTIHGTGPLDDIRYGRSLRGAGALLALAAGLLIPRAGAAQDADALRKEGAKLMGEGKLAEACPKLEESQRLAPSAGTLIDVAACHEKQGKIATAWQEFVDAEGEARKAGNRKIQADARARSAKLELRIPRLTVKIAAAAEGLEIKIDGVTLDRSSFNQPSPIDPGEHKVVASAPGKKAWEGSVSVKAAERKTISVPALADDPGAAAAAPAPPAAAPPVKEAPRAPQPAAAPEAPPPEPEVTTHQAERLVIDVGAGPGFLLGVIGEGSLTNIQSYVYDFHT